MLIPGSLVEIDSGNPLTRDLVVALSPLTGQPVNLMTQFIATKSNGDLETFPAEVGPTWRTYKATPNNIDTGYRPPNTGLHSFFIFARMRSMIFGTSEYFVSSRVGSNGGFTFAISTKGGTGRVLNYTNGGVITVDQTGEITLPNNEWASFGFVNRIGAPVDFYFRGNLVSTNNTGSMSATADTLHFGRDPIFNQGALEADTAVVLYWRRLLSPHEMASLNADPFQLFRPAVRRFAFDVAAGGGPVAYEDSLSLGIASGLTGTGSASASAALAIGTRAGTGLSPQAAASGALALGMQSGLSSSGAASVSGAIGLAFDAGLGLSGQASAADLAALALGFGLGIGTGGAFTDSLTLGIASGLSNTGSAGAAAGLTIGTAAGLSASGLATALSALSLGVGIGISNSDGATQHYSDGIQLSQGLALQAASVAQGSDAITLSYTTRVEVAGQGAAVAVISLDLSAGLQQQATANVMDAISIGAAIGQAIAAVMGGLVPPASRTFTVGSDDRIIRVSIDLRRYDA